MTNVSSTFKKGVYSCTDPLHYHLNSHFIISLWFQKSAPPFSCLTILCQAGRTPRLKTSNFLKWNQTGIYMLLLEVSQLSTKMRTLPLQLPLRIITESVGPRRQITRLRNKLRIRRYRHICLIQNRSNLFNQPSHLTWQLCKLIEKEHSSNIKVAVYMEQPLLLLRPLISRKEGIIIMNIYTRLCVFLILEN